MIKVYNNSSEEPNIEVTSVCFEEVPGQTPCLITHLNRADLDSAQQTIYDNFVGLLGGTLQDEIANTVYSLNIDRMTSTALLEGTTEKDYSVDWDATQQSYADAFLQLAVDLNDVE